MIIEKLTEVVVNSKVIPVFGGTANINTGDTYLRSEAQPIFGRGPGAAGIQRSAISGLLIEVAGSGTRGTAPATDLLLKACALKGTNTPATSDVYAHDATLTTTNVSISVYQGDTLLNIMTTGVGDLTITGVPGQPLMASYDFIGNWTTPTEAANATTLSDDANAPIFKASTMTLASDDLVWRSFQFKTNNTLTERPDAGEATGINTPAITNINHRITLVAETPAFSVANYWTTWLASTKMAFSMVVGATAGNIITMACDVYHAAAPALSWESGIQLVTLDLECSELAADTKFSLAFT
jgi:hypothetical protein